MPNEHGMETKIWRNNTKTQTAECYETHHAVAIFQRLDPTHKYLFVRLDVKPRCLRRGISAD